MIIESREWMWLYICVDTLFHVFKSVTCLITCCITWPVFSQSVEEIIIIILFLTFHAHFIITLLSRSLVIWLQLFSCSRLELLSRRGCVVWQTRHLIRSTCDSSINIMISTDFDCKSSSRSSPDSSSSSTTNKSQSSLSNTSNTTTSTSSFLSCHEPKHGQSDSKRSIGSLSRRPRTPRHERIALSVSEVDGQSSFLSTSSHPYLQLISCHLFNRGFSHDFLHSLLQSLKEEQKSSKKSPLQVLMTADQTILEVSLVSILVFEIWYEIFFSWHEADDSCHWECIFWELMT